MESYIAKAKEIGITNAAIMSVSDMEIVPEYRKYCEENLCGKYGVVKACPPQCGTVEEMTQKMNQYKTALVLQNIFIPKDMFDMKEHAEAKKQLNMMTEEVMEAMKKDGVEDILMMGAGPWKTASCISAYCADAQKVAERVGFECWAEDGKVRYFTLLLF